MNEALKAARSQRIPTTRHVKPTINPSSHVSPIPASVRKQLPTQSKAACASGLISRTIKVIAITAAEMKNMAAHRGAVQCISMTFAPAGVVRLHRKLGAGSTLYQEPLPVRWLYGTIAALPNSLSYLACEHPPRLLNFSSRGAPAQQSAHSEELIYVVPGEKDNESSNCSTGAPFRQLRH